MNKLRGIDGPKRFWEGVYLSSCSLFALAALGQSARGIVILGLIISQLKAVGRWMSFELSVICVCG